MKKIYTALALLAAVGLGSGAQTFKSVAVNLKDGSKVEINLTDDLSATFDEENLLVTAGDQDVAVPRGTIESFTFSDKAFSGIDTPQADGAAPVVSGGNLVFGNLPEGSRVEVYSISGALVSEVVVSGEYTLGLDTLPAGAVVVKVNGVAYKIAARR